MGTRTNRSKNKNNETDSAGGAGKRRGISRRRALARLGLSAAVIYVAPAVLPLNKNAALASNLGLPHGGFVISHSPGHPPG